MSDTHAQTAGATAPRVDTDAADAAAEAVRPDARAEAKKKPETVQKDIEAARDRAKADPDKAGSAGK